VTITSAAAADWTLYVSGELGISSGSTDVSGLSELTPPAFSGSYGDSAPIIGGAFGIVMPLDELTPWNLPHDTRLPSWPISFEVELTGLRSFEGVTTGVNDTTPMFGGTQSWTMMVDVWQSFPVGALNRPISKLFGRVPLSLRRTLDRIDFEVGGGVGMSVVDIDFTDNRHVAQGSSTNFAWQVGGRFMYEVTDRIDLGVGYRYIDVGTVDARLLDPPPIAVPIDHGPFAVSQSAHEFRFNVRVKVWGFRSPWR
jgi:hypothetical protein